ncbi:MAG TPA: hypothetical protein ENF63_02485 [Candidatus Bathyarchaeota archaeon]|nr:hypothetical protein [Candidatus Bathyarchaeota archaeon]
MNDTNKSKKHSLFPVFMFIGMGVGFLLIESLGGLAFVSAMFIGMGLGFLFDSLVRIEERKVSVEIPVKASGIITLIIGAIFTVSGALALYDPNLLAEYSTYFIGLGFIIVGIYLMLYGFGLVKTT